MADLRFEAGVSLGNKVSDWLLQELENSVSMTLITEGVWIHFRSNHSPVTSAVPVVKNVCVNAHVCKNAEDKWSEKNGNLVGFSNARFLEKALSQDWFLPGHRRTCRGWRAAGGFPLKRVWRGLPGGPWEEQTGLLGMFLVIKGKGGFTENSVW